MLHPDSPNGSNGSSSAAAATIDERRRGEPRTLCDRDISIMTLDGEHADRFVTAHLTDCSAHGLGFTLKEPVKAGKQLLVRLNVDKMVLLVYTLRYCIPTKTSQFRAGARFTGYAASSFQEEPQRIISALTGEG